MKVIRLLALGLAQQRGAGFGGQIWVDAIQGPIVNRRGGSTGEKIILAIIIISEFLAVSPPTSTEVVLPTLGPEVPVFLLVDTNRTGSGSECCRLRAALISVSEASELPGSFRNALRPNL